MTPSTTSTTSKQDRRTAGPDSKLKANLKANGKTGLKATPKTGKANGPRNGMSNGTGNGKANGDSSARKIVVRDSIVHGKGVYAARLLKKGERIIEYKGEHIEWPEALRRHPHDPSQPNHTFYFALDGDAVIDGRVQGNSARWINHSCEPNCEASLSEVRGRQRVFIEALRNIKPGEELFYDYGLVIDKPLTKKLKAEYACRCGSSKCRGTLLATSK